MMPASATPWSFPHPRRALAARSETSPADRIAAEPLTRTEEIAASVVHEVNQPLTAIAADAAACLRWLGKDRPRVDEARKAAKRIVAEVLRARKIVDRMRALGAGRSSAMSELNINEVVENVRGLMQAELDRSDVLLATDLSAALPPVLGDGILLQQLLVNLVVNGIEAMTRITPGMRLLRISTRRDASGNALVAVADSGPGLDPAIIDRVFDPLFSTKPHGMGMGLFICRSIVETHGGQIWATANLPQGARFQFSLPAQQGPRMGRRLIASASDARGKVRRKHTDPADLSGTGGRSAR
jgi:signal transduction histidine kinase